MDDLSDTCFPDVLIMIIGFKVIQIPYSIIVGVRSLLCFLAPC